MSITSTPSPSVVPVRTGPWESTASYYYRLKLRNCGNLRDVKSIHAQATKHRLDEDQSLARFIIRMYLKFGGVEEGRLVFQMFNFQDVALWTAIISAHAQSGHPKEASQLFHSMQQHGVLPNVVTFIVVLNVWIALQDFMEGKRIYERAVSCGHASNVVLSNCFLNLHARCSSPKETRWMLEQMQIRNSVSWTILMNACNRFKRWEETLLVFRWMQLEGSTPDNASIIAALCACTEVCSLVQGRLVHAACSEVEQDATIASTLVNMYSKCGDLDWARATFGRVQEKSLTLWNTMIAACVYHSHPSEALQLLNKMQLEGIKANRVTFLNSIGACCSIGHLCLPEGRRIHMCCYESGYQGDIVLETALLNMYMKCGSTEDATSVFYGIKDKNVVSWNAMMAGYTQNAHAARALRLFREMDLEGVAPSRVTFATVLDACGDMEALTVGPSLHGRLVNSGVEMGLVLATALVRMYGKCRCLEKARLVFDGIISKGEQDVVLWTSMLGVYLDHGCHGQALELFWKMSIKPDKITFVCAVDACANAGKLEQAEEIHERITKSSCETNVLVGTALCYMYMQFGCLERAMGIFNRLEARSVVSWNAVVAGFANRGCSAEAVEHFSRMLQEGVKPNAITYAALLDVVSSVAQGRFVHALIIESGLEMCVFVGTALLTMYGKCGSLEHAWSIFSKLGSHRRNTVSWNALITAYARNGLVALSLEVFQELQQEGLFADTVTFQSIMSACSHAGLVQEGCEYMMLMIEDHGIVPLVEHYSCMIDLLGRAGWLKEAEDLVVRLPEETQASTALSLLSACRTHGDANTATRVGQMVIESSSAYALLSTTYAQHPN